MAPLPRRRWQDMTTREFALIGDVARVIALLPVAAIEQHGPHLPLAVDAALNEAIVARAVALMPEALPVLVLPMMPVGLSSEHAAFPGTLTLSAGTLTALWTEIGESVRRAGVRKLVLFNSHGGQPQIMDVVARDLRVRMGMLVVACSWFRLGIPEGLFPAEEIRHGIHGGSVETSMMLHVQPGLVNEGERRPFESLSSELEHTFRHLSPVGRVGFGWQTQDLNADGACGDASDADAARGSALVEHAARELLTLLDEVDRFPLDRLRDRR